jgi:excisionase family DNA binding protein
MQRKKKTAAENHLRMEEGYATVPEVADFLGLSRAKIYGLMDAGELAFCKFGTARRLPWRSVKAYAEACMVQG